MEENAKGRCNCLWDVLECSSKDDLKKNKIWKELPFFGEGGGFVWCELKDLKNSEASIPPSVHVSSHPILQIILVLKLYTVVVRQRIKSVPQTADLCLLFDSIKCYI